MKIAKFFSDEISALPNFLAYGNDIKVVAKRDEKLKSSNNSDTVGVCALHRYRHLSRFNSLGLEVAPGN